MDKDTKKQLREVVLELLDRDAPAVSGIAWLARKEGRDPVRAVEAYVLDYLVGCVSDGLRRPGSWEAQWAEMAGLA